MYRNNRSKYINSFLPIPLPLLPIPLPIPLLPFPTTFMNNNINPDFGYMGGFKIIQRQIKPDNSVWNCIYNQNNGLFEWYLDGYYTPNIYYNLPQNTNAANVDNANANNVDNVDNVDKYRPLTINDMFENLSTLHPEIDINKKTQTQNNNRHNNRNNNRNSNRHKHKRNKSYDANLENINEEVSDAVSEEVSDADADADEPPPLSYFENEEEIFV